MLGMSCGRSNSQAVRLSNFASDILHSKTSRRLLKRQTRKARFNHNPKASLYQVSRSLSANHHRRERLIQTTDLDEAATVADPTPTAEAIVYSRQCLTQTRKALAELPERTRKAFKMHRPGGLTLQQVADQPPSRATSEIPLARPIAQWRASQSSSL